MKISIILPRAVQNTVWPCFLHVSGWLEQDARGFEPTRTAEHFSQCQDACEGGLNQAVMTPTRLIWTSPTAGRLK